MNNELKMIDYTVRILHLHRHRHQLLKCIYKEKNTNLSKTFSGVIRRQKFVFLFQMFLNY